MPRARRGPARPGAASFSGTPGQDGEVNMWAATHREQQPEHSQRSPTHQEGESGRIMPGRPPELSEEDRGLVVAGLRHCVELAERILERHMGDGGTAERDHAAPAGVDH